MERSKQWGPTKTSIRAGTIYKCINDLEHGTSSAMAKFVHNTKPFMIVITRMTLKSSRRISTNWVIRC